MRRPPPPPVPPGGARRAARGALIAALHGTGVPVPEVLAVAQAGEVLDVPFYVMSYVEGAIATTETPPGLDGREIAFAMVDTLKALHAVDWRARGLEGFGRPEGFNARHLQADGAAGRGPLRAVRAVLRVAVGERAAGVRRRDPARRLPARQPDAGARRRRASPPCSTGSWRRSATRCSTSATSSRPIRSRARPRTPTQDLGDGVAAIPAGPARGELAERYGGDLSRLRWYTVMAMWKLAVLYEYSHRRGEDAYYADPALVQRFLAAAHREAGLGATVLEEI